MPRSFLVKKYFAKQKPNYSELECQNGEFEGFFFFFMSCVDYEILFKQVRKLVETTCFPVRFYLNVYESKAPFWTPLPPSFRRGPLGAPVGPSVTTHCPIHVKSSCVNTWEETAR